MTQFLGNIDNTMFFKVDENGNPIGCCFRIHKWTSSFMFGSNDINILYFIEKYLKENRTTTFPNIFELHEETEVFEIAQQIAKELIFLPFIN